MSCCVNPISWAPLWAYTFSVLVCESKNFKTTMGLVYLTIQLASDLNLNLDRLCVLDLSVSNDSLLVL